MNTDNSPRSWLTGLGVLVVGVLASAAPTTGAVPMLALAAVGYAVLEVRDRLGRAGRAPDAPRQGWELVLAAAVFGACIMLLIWLVARLWYGSPVVPLWPP